MKKRLAEAERLGFRVALVPGPTERSRARWPVKSRRAAQFGREARFGRAAQFDPAARFE